MKKEELNQKIKNLERDAKNLLSEIEYDIKNDILNKCTLNYEKEILYTRIAIIDQRYCL